MLLHLVCNLGRWRKEVQRPLTGNKLQGLNVGQPESPAIRLVPDRAAIGNAFAKGGKADNTTTLELTKFGQSDMWCNIAQIPLNALILVFSHAFGGVY